MIPFVAAIIGLLTLLAYLHPRLSDQADRERAESTRRIIAEIRRIEQHDPERIIDRRPD